MMSKNYQYFVEGECEEKLINTLKTPQGNALLAGKVEVFNIVSKKLSNQRIAVLKPDTIIILVYDTDIQQTEILEENIKKLEKYGFKKIYHVQSIYNFEDEIVYSTSLKRIGDMYGTSGRDEFKKIFLRQNNLLSKLEKIGFDKDKLWCRLNDKPPFNKFSSQDALKLIKKK